VQENVRFYILHMRFFLAIGSELENVPICPIKKLLKQIKGLMVDRWFFVSVHLYCRDNRWQ